jgi:polysaccharide pyruvyl transferase WcaK-like protein
MRIALFNVKYSPNLGDGLLAECLERELADSQTEATTLDLAGRLDYGDGLSRHRRSVLAILDHSPPFLRRSFVRLALGRAISKRLRPLWQKTLATADAVVVGGGNLFADQDLNFPLKVSAALDAAAGAGLPVGIFGVGVSDDWSPPGRALFARALQRSNLAYVAVRDDRSRQSWIRGLRDTGIKPATLCRDPGVLAARHFPSTRQANHTKRIALGVTDPLALRYHAVGAAVTEAGLTSWIAELVTRLVASQNEVILFTNGSPEDQAYMTRIGPRLIARGPGQVSVAPAFKRPHELASFISGVDLVLAHRLHANIAAFAYRVPHIGFVWDPKLHAFFEATGRSAFVATACVDSPAQIAGLAERAMKEGLDAELHRRIVDAARDDIKQLRQSLGGLERARPDA